MTGSVSRHKFSTPFFVEMGGLYNYGNSYRPPGDLYIGLDHERQGVRGWYKLAGVVAAGYDGTKFVVHSKGWRFGKEY